MNPKYPSSIQHAWQHLGFVFKKMQMLRRARRKVGQDEGRWSSTAVWVTLQSLQPLRFFQPALFVPNFQPPLQFMEESTATKRSQNGEAGL